VTTSEATCSRQGQRAVCSNSTQSQRCCSTYAALRDIRNAQQRAHHLVLPELASLGRLEVGRLPRHLLTDVVSQLREPASSSSSNARQQPNKGL
jgi:hypothetical protein